MFEILIIVALGVLCYKFSFLGDQSDLSMSSTNQRIGKLWDLAHDSIRSSRLLRAEKALLTILKIDEKNAAAYNRLGILYAKQKEYKDAIDCFEIASSIEPTASSLHNLGLIYYETENYEKAQVAFEQALKLEDSLAARHVAYAKVAEKLGNDKMMFSELNKAVELETNKETLQLLLRAYEARGKTEKAAEIRSRLDKIIIKNTGKRHKVIRPNKAVI